MALIQLLSKDAVNEAGESTNAYGFDFPKCYFRIAYIGLDINNDRVTIRLRGYASKDARNYIIPANKEETIGVYKQNFECTLKDINFINKDGTAKQKLALKSVGYTYLASLPEFVNSKKA